MGGPVAMWAEGVMFFAGEGEQDKREAARMLIRLRWCGREALETAEFASAQSSVPVAADVGRRILSVRRFARTDLRGYAGVGAGSLPLPW